jgi:transcriptional regulator with XRE-family HTH domain
MVTLTNHAHIISACPELILTKGGSLEIVIIARTDLPLLSSEQGFDAAAISGLQYFVKEFEAASGKKVQVRRQQQTADVNLKASSAPPGSSPMRTALRRSPREIDDGMTPAQCRAARGLIWWTQLHLANAAGVSDVTVLKFESEQAAPPRASLQDMQFALEAAGVIFVPGNGEGPGVRLTKEPAAVVAAIDQKIEALESHLEAEDVKAGSNPEAAMQQLERAHKKNEVVKLKNKRTTLRNR